MEGRPKILYSKCIGNFYDTRAMYFIRNRERFSSGLYDYAGTYGQQPNKFVETMELVQNLTMQQHDEQQEKLKKAQMR